MPHIQMHAAGVFVDPIALALWNDNHQNLAYEYVL